MSPRTLWAYQQRPAGTLPRETPGRDPAVRTTIAHALDAAQRAGAIFADVRVTITAQRAVGEGSFSESVAHGMGIRALVNGYWGFASTPYLGNTEAGRIGQDATALATTSSAQGRPRDATLAQRAIVQNGDWTMPVKIDPMQVDIEEVLDWQDTYTSAMQQRMNERRPGKLKDIQFGKPAILLKRTDVICACSNGGYTVQTFFSTDVAIGFSEYKLEPKQVGTNLISDCNYIGIDQHLISGFSAGGWEKAVEFPGEKILECTAQAIERDLALPVKSIDVGRYDVVCDWALMGDFVSRTLGVATQLDRAIGDEANATGTSYLGPNPVNFLATKIASPQVSLSGERSTPGAAGTVQWDTEGVVPTPFPIVKNGTLVDYQTTRESAAWLQTHGRATAASPAASHGCAGSAGDTALDVPMQHPPNLVLKPGADEVTFDELVSSMRRGLAIRNGRIGQTDFQAINGQAGGSVYEVVNGRIVARVAGASILFRAHEFWKNIQVVGGAKSARWSTGSSIKGEPEQSAAYSVSAPPAYVTNVAIIDPSRDRA